MADLGSSFTRAELGKAFELGYVHGHADAAADIYRNASTAALSIQEQLDEQQGRQAEAVAVAMRQRCEADKQAAIRSAIVANITRRMLALRQYIEMRRCALGSRASKPWRLTVRRSSLLDDMLNTAFSQLVSSPRRQALLFAPTVVSFVSALGDVEDGDDRGGLTAEMFTLFWREALQPEAKLFEGGGSSWHGRTYSRLQESAHMSALSLSLSACLSLWPRMMLLLCPTRPLSIAYPQARQARTLSSYPIRMRNQGSSRRWALGWPNASWTITRSAAA